MNEVRRKSIEKIAGQLSELKDELEALFQESKIVKHWKAGCAVICNGMYEKDSFVISAVNIVEAVNRATELLETVAKEFGAEK